MNEMNIEGVAGWVWSWADGGYHEGQVWNVNTQKDGAEGLEPRVVMGKEEPGSTTGGRRSFFVLEEGGLNWIC